MQQIVVHYKLKPGRTAENEALIEQVFRQLQERAPAGLRYASFKAADGLSFMHLVSVETEDGSNPLSQLDAFKAFTADIASRCDEPPAPTPLSLVGSYGFFEG